MIRRLVRENPWALLVSCPPSRGVVVSHVPVRVDDGPELTLLGHLGRPDEEQHEPGAHDVLVVAGPNGYASPAW